MKDDEHADAFFFLSNCDAKPNLYGGAWAPGLRTVSKSPCEMNATSSHQPASQPLSKLIHIPRSYTPYGLATRSLNLLNPSRQPINVNPMLISKEYEATIPPTHGGSVAIAILTTQSRTDISSRLCQFLHTSNPSTPRRGSKTQLTDYTGACVNR